MCARLRIGDLSGPLSRGDKLVCKDDIIMPRRSSKSKVKVVRDFEMVVLSNIIHRTGIIQYTIVNNGDILYSMGVDGKSGELSDYGGTFSARFDKFPSLGACREESEETLKLIGHGVTELLDEPCLIHNGVLIIFAYVEFEKLMNVIEKYPETHYNSAMINGKMPEMKALKLLLIDDLEKAIKDKVVYSVVIDTISSDIRKIDNYLKSKALSKLCIPDN